MMNSLIKAALWSAHMLMPNWGLRICVLMFEEGRRLCLNENAAFLDVFNCARTALSEKASLGMAVRSRSIN